MSSDGGHEPHLSDEDCFVFTVYTRTSDVLSVHKHHTVSKTEVKICLEIDGSVSHRERRWREPGGME